MKKPNIKIYRDYEIGCYEKKWWVINEDNSACVCVDTKEHAKYLKKNYTEWDYKSADLMWE